MPSARPTPPKIAAAAPHDLTVSDSPSQITPPIAAKTGTVSCTTAARVLASLGSAAYHKL